MLHSLLVQKGKITSPEAVIKMIITMTKRMMMRRRWCRCKSVIAVLSCAFIFLFPSWNGLWVNVILFRHNIRVPTFLSLSPSLLPRINVDFTSGRRGKPRDYYNLQITIVDSIIPREDHSIIQLKSRPPWQTLAPRKPNEGSGDECFLVTASLL